MAARTETITRVVKFCIDTKSMQAHQRDLLDRHAGTHRAVWNWALAQRNEQERLVRSLVREQAGLDAVALFGVENHETVQAVYADSGWRKFAFSAAKSAAPTTFTHSAIGLGKEFTRISRGAEVFGYDRGGNPKSFAWWTYEKHGVNRFAVSEPLRALDTAVSDFYSGKSKKGSKKRRDGMPSGWPTFKSKRDGGQFAVANLSNKAAGARHILDDSSASGQRIRVPNIGSFRVHNDLRRLRRYIAKGGTPKSARFTQVADRWYVAINVSFEADNPYVAPRPTSKRQKSNGTVGVDRGVKVLAALSTGEMFDGLQPAKAAQDKKARIQRKAAKAVRGSNRHKRLIQRAARLDHQVALKRATAQHHLTKHLTTTFETVVMEDLRIKQMTKKSAPKPDPDRPGHFLPNRKKAKSGLNRSMLDAGLYEIQRQLQYKSARYGSTVAAVDPAYTSQRCSRCGHTCKENRESQAVFKCVACGNTANADVNAAINIRNRHLGHPGTAVNLTVLNRRAESRKSGPGQPANATASLKREGLDSPSGTSQSGRSNPPALLDSA
jgi:putative transposase